MSGALDVWIASADDWESDSKPRGRGRNSYGGDKYNKNKDPKGKNYGKDDNYKKDGSRKKRSNSRVRFPVRHFPDYRRFPVDRFPPLLSIFSMVTNLL